MKMIENKKGLLNCFQKIRSLSRGFFFSRLPPKNAFLQQLYGHKSNGNFFFLSSNNDYKHFFISSSTKYVIIRITVYEIFYVL